MRQILLFILLVLLISNGRTQSSSLDSLRLVMPIAHSGPITYSEFSDDGRFIATASMDNTIILWDVASAKLIRKLEGHDDFLKEVKFNHNSSVLYSTSWDNKIKCWDVMSGELIDILQPSGENISSITISANDDFLVCTTYDDKIDVWNLNNKNKTTLSTNIESLIGVSISQNNKLFIVCESKVLIYDIDRSDFIKSIEANKLYPKHKKSPIFDSTIKITTWFFVLIKSIFTFSTRI